MRTSTKLKTILSKGNTVGVSLDEDGWNITVISNTKPPVRVNINGKSFLIVVDKAYKQVCKKTVLQHIQWHNSIPETNILIQSK